jgi:hypothetical protein
MYLTYDGYKTLGGKLNEPDFNRAGFAACMEIDSLTADRLRGEDPVREIVKRLVLELVERGYCGSLNGKEITSNGNDGRSQSYESNQGKATALIKKWLGNEKIDGVFLIDRGGIQFVPVVRV